MVKTYYQLLSSLEQRLFGISIHLAAHKSNSSFPFRLENPSSPYSLDAIITIQHDGTRLAAGTCSIYVQTKSLTRSFSGAWISSIDARVAPALPR